jgi:hypothetical protein
MFADASATGKETVLQRLESAATDVQRAVAAADFRIWAEAEGLLSKPS